MKKNTLDKQLIKALAIGISASMAMQPVTALANEGENTVPSSDNNVSEKQEDKSEKEIEKDFSDEVDAAKDSVDKLGDAVKNVETADSASTGDSYISGYEDVATDKLVGEGVNDEIKDTHKELSLLEISMRKMNQYLRMMQKSLSLQKKQLTKKSLT